MTRCVLWSDSHFPFSEFIGGFCITAPAQMLSFYHDCPCPLTCDFGGLVFRYIRGERTSLTICPSVRPPVLQMVGLYILLSVCPLTLLKNHSYQQYSAAAMSCTIGGKTSLTIRKENTKENTLLDVV